MRSRTSVTVVGCQSGHRRRRQRDAGDRGALHDAAEDRGGEARLDEIERRFGPAVTAIVAACSDTFEIPKPEWKERKQRYLAHLEHAPSDVLTVSLADKLDNSRAILRDFRATGDELWTRFNTGNPQDQIWYYRELADVFERRASGPMADELGRVVSELERLVAHPEHRTA